MRDRLYDTVMAMLLVVLAASGWLVAEVLHSLSDQLARQEGDIRDIRALVAKEREDRAAIIAQVTRLVEDSAIQKASIADIHRRMIMAETSITNSLHAPRRKESP